MKQAARIFVTGISGSGKTLGAWEWYISKAPRVLIVDQIGEWKGRVFETVNTLAELHAVITEARKQKTWRIAYTNADDRLHDLVRWLLPLPEVERSPVVALGGMLLVLDEVDLIAPAGGAPEVIRNLYRRSRHVGLSIVSATQRPANVLREVSAQSTQVLAYRLTEPRDRDYLADLMRWDSHQLGEYARWTQRYQHGAVWRDLVTGQTLWVSDSRRLYRTTGEVSRRQSEAAQQQPAPAQPPQLPAVETSPSRSPESLPHSSSTGENSDAPNDAKSGIVS